jgi:hypothetical protein
MALMSMTNVPCRACRPLRKRSPSTIDAALARVPPPSGRIGYINSRARWRRKEMVSTQYADAMLTLAI